MLWKINARRTMKNHILKHSQSVDWRILPDLSAWVIEQGLAIQQIPAPTFEEHTRAEAVAQQFAALGLTDIRTDEMLNVYGRLRGTNADLPAVMVVAHTDTVFGAETDLTLRHEGGLIYGPGLGDNSMGVAGMLGLVEGLRRLAITPNRDLWIVATSREEGLGNLDGMRAAFEALRPSVSHVINLEGLAFGHVYHAGIAVRRLHITASAEGGHSWLHFGRASAIHGIMSLGAQIAKIVPPSHPRTTYNIGIIEGGQSVNSIAAQASMWLDLRSEHPDALEKLERSVRRMIADHQSDELTFTAGIVGDRPAGSLATEHPHVQAALATLATLGVQGILETGSTDGNISLAAGVPTVTIGITRGGNAHRLDEFIETEPVAAGMQQLITLTLATAAQTPR